jgi:hypothetical protein
MTMTNSFIYDNVQLYKPYKRRMLYMIVNFVLEVIHIFAVLQQALFC